MIQPSEKDPKPSEPCSSPRKLSDQQTAQKHVNNVSAQTPDGDSSGWTATKHLSISTHCPAISVSTQTEQLRPGSTESAPECHCVHTQTDTGTEIEEEDLNDASAHLPQDAPSAGRKTSDKMLFSSSFPIPADPVRLAERIRRNRTQLSAAFDDTEYEPYGLPEVVMKGTILSINNLQLGREKKKNKEQAAPYKNGSHVCLTVLKFGVQIHH